MVSFRFASGLETYVVTLNAWPNVDILVNLEKMSPCKECFPTYHGKSRYLQV